MNTSQKFADLHVHTFYSDSTDSPEQVVEQAVRFGLSCISITDHDTLEGVIPTKKAAQGTGLEIVPGVELSATIDGKDLHLLGYFVKCEEGPLSEILDKAQETRVTRIEKMIQKLQELGIDNIELDEVCALTETRSVGRPHLATILVKKGWASSIWQAFAKYLAEGRPAYVPKYKVSPFEAIDLIKQSGGISVLAHPMSTNKDEIIPSLVEHGLQGIEVEYPNFPKTAIAHYKGIATKYSLVITGGSDAHGEAKQNTYIGKARVPYECVEKLKQLRS